jgi:hypothetical protein
LRFTSLIPNLGGPPCDAAIPGGAHFLTFAASGSAADFAHDAGCLAIRGVGGCGFEQPLEALLKAVTPASSPTTFYGSTSGHLGPAGGSQANAGFLRPNAMLVVIVLTDEEDCSADDTTLFDVGVPATYDSTSPNLTCWVNGGSYPGRASKLHPLARYVDGLLAVKPSSLLLFAAITGIAPSLTADDVAGFDAILADPSMIEQRDGPSGSTLVPSCTYTGGNAYPPRRIVGLARAIAEAGATAVVSSICQESYIDPVATILEKIADAFATE